MIQNIVNRQQVCLMEATRKSTNERVLMICGVSAGHTEGVYFPLAVLLDQDAAVDDYQSHIPNAIVKELPDDPTGVH